jgi:excisionase family DNA binding protein
MSIVSKNPDPSPARRLWTIKETASALGVSPRTVWRLVGTGALKSTRLGRCVRVVANSVDELIERGGAR